MYSGGFYPYKTAEEMWAYWSKYIIVNRYMDAPKPVYDKLLELVRDRDYFVITTKSVNEQTLDEAPMAYKSLDEIIGVIQDCVDIMDIMKPVYYFKAAD